MSRFDELLTKEMTRRQFLATIGLAFVSLFGLSTIMGILTGNDPHSRSSKTTGYGNSGYGR